MNDAAGRLYERMLVLRCRAGDEAALGELISRNAANVSAAQNE